MASFVAEAEEGALQLNPCPWVPSLNDELFLVTQPEALEDTP